VRDSGTKKDIDFGASVSIGRDERNVLGLFKEFPLTQPSPLGGED
jgi:hypothetical protein